VILLYLCSLLLHNKTTREKQASYKPASKNKQARTSKQASACCSGQPGSSARGGLTTLKVCNNDDDDDVEDATAAATTILSRTVLLPYLDMLNHDDINDPNTSIEVVVEIPDGCDESFHALRALRPIKAGDQLTISYGTGRETSLDLFSKYGFWTTENPFDCDIDWDNAAKARWTTSLRQDELSLEKVLLDEAGGSDNDDDDDNSSLASPQKTILSLRIHLKKLLLQCS